MHIVPQRVRRLGGPIGLFLLAIMIILTPACSIADASALVMNRNSELVQVSPPSLRSNELQTLEQITVQDHQLIFMSESGVAPNIPASLLAKQVAVNIGLAGRAISSNVDALGKSNPLEAVTSLWPQKRHYVVFSSNKALFDQLSRATAGQVSATGWGFTVFDAEISVAFIRVPVAGEISPIPSAPDTEMCQLIVKSTATPASVGRYGAVIAAAGAQATPEAVQKKLDIDAQEIFCNSVGRAAYVARSGQSYRDYLRRIPTFGVAVHGSTVPVIVINEQTFRALADLS